MPVTVLVGTQWGDEGKGKIIDVMTENADVVIRFQGGNNAGHTVEFDDQKFVLHLIPSGIFRKGTVCVIGNGLVVNPVALMEEMQDLEKRGIDISNLMVSAKSHLIMPYHQMFDSLRENLRSEERKIGTTKRGIGPAYADKAYRCGIRAAALLDIVQFEKLFREEAEKYNKLFSFYGHDTIDVDAEWNKVKTAAEYIVPYVQDTVYKINEAAKSGKRILFEGAQGALLDIDHGTYPFVTSSNTTSAGACTGTGLPPRYIGDVVGVIKAYTTRVGAGPFPTELTCEEGENLRKIGNEFGATTGRPRRCGWFDAVASKYSCMVNGVNKLAITKLDVLDQCPELSLCTAYEINGKKTDQFPASVEELKNVVPVYEKWPGWMESTNKASSFSELPEKAQSYLKRLSELVDAEISIISVGPGRDQTFSVK